MKRVSVIPLLLLVLPVLGVAPGARAAGVGACTIIGTTELAPSVATPSEGIWRVEARIQCHGLYRGRDRYDGSGPFRGSGSYTALPGASGACLNQSGTGIVEYELSTTLGTFRISEQYSFVLAGAGAFQTPSLDGSFQVSPPYSGNCLTEPLTRGGFHAEAVSLTSVVSAGSTSR